MTLSKWRLLVSIELIICLCNPHIKRKLFECWYWCYDRKLAVGRNLATAATFQTSKKVAFFSRVAKVNWKFYFIKSFDFGIFIKHFLFYDNTIVCSENFKAIDDLVHRPASFKVPRRKTKIGKVVRGTHDLRRPVGCCARKRGSHELIFRNRYVNLVHSSDWSCQFDTPAFRWRDLESVRFWSERPS